jgi:hypothetical protein
MHLNWQSTSLGPHAVMQRPISAWAELAAAEEESVVVGAWALANSARPAVRKMVATRMLVVVSNYR